MAITEFPIPTQGERGDLHDRDLSLQALRLCQNMHRSQKGRLTLRPGYDLLSATNPGVRVMGIIGFSTAASADRAVVGTTTGVWQYNSATSAWVDITLAGSELTGSNSDHVRGVVMAISGVYNVILMNGVNSPKIWDGAAAAYSNLGGSPGTFISGMVIANRLIGLVSPETIWVSAFNDPQTWPSGNGSRIKLVDCGDLMVGTGRLSRTAGAVLGEESQWLVTAQSGSSPFRVDRVSEASGPLSSAAIVEYGASDDKKLYWLAKDYNSYVFNGRPASAIGWAMRPFVTDNIDRANEKQTHGWYDDQTGKICWLFPVVGAAGPTRGIFLDPRTGEMGRLIYGNPITAAGRMKSVFGVTYASLASYTYADIAATYPSYNSFGDLSSQRRVALGDAAGNIFLSGTGDGSDNGSPIEFAFETPIQSHGGIEFNFVPSTFESWFQQSTNSVMVELNVGSSDTLMADPTYTSMGSFDISTDQRNDIDLTSLGEKRFVTVKHSGQCTNGQVNWLGGIFRAESTGVNAGPV